MSYELKPDQPIGLELARVIAEETDAIVESLGAPDASATGTRIHRCRVALKRARAALSIAKPLLPKFYKRQNAIYREAGRKLSELRDAEVMIETFDKLQQKYHAELANDSIQPIRRLLLSRRKRARAGEQNLPDLAIQLKTTRGSLSKLKTVQDAAPAIQDVYRRGRNAFVEAYQHPASTAFHQWRKSVKRHLYCVEMMEKGLPELWKSYRKGLKQLADILGDDHNLAVLQETLPRSAARLSGMIEQWQAELRAEAAALGTRIYDEKPRQFSKRLGKSWRSAA